MKIAVVYRPPALDAETYKATWASDVAKGNPEGLIFHAGVGEGDDFFTMSVWESQEAYNAFASGFKETLGDAGFAGGKPLILPVHHTTTAFLPEQPDGPRVDPTGPRQAHIPAARRYEVLC